ncbi:MAG: cell division protein FtsX [Acidimicrobiales bacterium]
MTMSMEYAAREAAGNLWRNRLMTVTAVLTVAVSLSLLGATMLMRQAVSSVTVNWGKGVNIIVFMHSGATGGQRKAVNQQLTGMPQVSRCYYVGHAASFAEMKRMFRSEPDVYQQAGLTASEVPTSFRCALANPKDAQVVASAFQNEPGVRSVYDPVKQANTIQKVSGIIQLIFVIVAVILLLSAAVLILNTIRLAIFARRREVAVMKLVGATNWFIRVPFMLEGLTQGIIGAVVATGVVFGMHAFLGYVVTHYHATLLKSLVVPLHDVVSTVVVVFLVGMVVGVLGSVIAIRRFLEV